MRFRLLILFVFMFIAGRAIGQTSDSLLIERIRKSQLNTYKPDSIIKLVWEINNHNWINEWRGIYFYNSDGLMKNELISSWQNEKWQIEYKNDFAYIGIDISEQIKYWWEDYYSEWIPANKYSFEYNEFNFISQKIDYNWLQLQNKWVNDTLIIYQYDSTGQLTDKYVNVWSNYINDWENNSWTNYSYINGNNDNQTYSIWDFDYLIWDGRRIAQFFYNSDNQMTEQSLMQKKSLFENWLNDSKIEYKYNTDSLIKEEIYWYWDAVQQSWFEDYKISYVYDINSRLANITLYYYDWYYLEWINRYQTIYDYNIDNQLVQATYYNWNYEQWVNQYCYNYFYPGYTSINKEEPYFSVKLFPNPATDLVLIDFGKPVLSDIHIQIIDLNGKEFYTNIYHDIGSVLQIRLPKLNEGIYFIRSKVGSIVLTEKIIIRKY